MKHTPVPSILTWLIEDHSPPSYAQGWRLNDTYKTQDSSAEDHAKRPTVLFN